MRRESNTPVEAVGVLEEQHPHIPPAPLPATLPGEEAAVPVPPAQLTLQAKLAYVGLAWAVLCQSRAGWAHRALFLLSWAVGAALGEHSSLGHPGMFALFQARL